MCKRLAEDFSTVWVPEAGRDIIANSNDFTYEDLQLVASAHAKRIIQQSRLANKVMFVDTNLAMTKSYAKHFFGKVPDFAPWIEKANECDMYVNLCADAPYVDDGTRLPKKERDVLAVEHEKMFKEEGMEYVTFCWGGSGMDSYESRYNKVVDWVSNFISKF
jgi:HTH-type transcriptional repressor of NAD biosynthesis genes